MRLLGIRNSFEFDRAPRLFPWTPWFAEDTTALFELCTARFTDGSGTFVDI